MYVSKNQNLNFSSFLPIEIFDVKKISIYINTDKCIYRTSALNYTQQYSFDRVMRMDKQKCICIFEIRSFERAVSVYMKMIN